MSQFTAQNKNVLDTILKGRLTKAEGARGLHISRKTIYIWLKLREGELSKRRDIVNSKNIEKKVIVLATSNPKYGPKKLVNLLLEKGIKTSVRTVWLILKRHNLEKRKLREINSSLYSVGKKGKSNEPKFILRYTPEARKRMVEDVLLLDKKTAEISKIYRVSRKTLSKWKTRYLLAREGGENLILAVSDLNPKGEFHPRGYKEEIVKKVLRVVISNPSLSSHKISALLGNVGNHGVQNILKRNNLSHYQMRLAYSQNNALVKKAMLPKPVPSLGDRVKSVFESFTPQVSPAPPPSSSFPSSPKLSLAYLLRVFGTSSLVSFLFSFGFILWVDVLSSASGWGERAGLVFASVALVMGSFFFLYSLKYYLTLALVLSFSQQGDKYLVGEGGFNGGKNFLFWLFGINLSKGVEDLRGSKVKSAVGLNPNLEKVTLKRYPKVSVHIPLYNEKNVVERALAASTNFDYPDYEVVVCDDSTDETTSIINAFIKKNCLPSSISTTQNKTEGWNLTTAIFREGKGQGGEGQVVVKHLHRTTRSGFKGGALKLALSVATDPEVEFVSIFDADFVPYPDSLTLFLKYFKVQNNLDEDYTKTSVAAVQGYQWHVLNKSENWITRGVRSEYAGSYVIERSGTEIYGGLKQISGSVYMIRRDVLESIGWGTSITEDFELTLKLYEKGWKVVYTPYIQAPAECVSTVKRLVRQRMRWAEGHSNNIKRMFFSLLTSKSLTFPEKLEFIYLSPYYLQAFFFLVGTISWLVSETVFASPLPFWTSVWGWSLVLTNMLSLPLMNSVGLFLEESEEKDYLGIASFVALSYLVVPFQAYASAKGFLERQEGPWFRTPKTGRITEVVNRSKFYRLIQKILPGKTQSAVNYEVNNRTLNYYLGLSTANNKFNKGTYENTTSGLFDGFFDINLNRLGMRSIRIAKRFIFTKSVLASLLSIVMFINYMAYFVYQRTPQVFQDQTIMKEELTDQNITNNNIQETVNEKTGNVLAAGGTEIAKIKTNTNFKENPKARELLPQSGEVLASDINFPVRSPQNFIVKDGIYRWETKLLGDTSLSLGLQERNGISPTVKVSNKEGWFVRFESSMPNMNPIVEPGVRGNEVEWQMSPGIKARYKALNDRLKADYIVENRSALVDDNRLSFLVQYNDGYSGDTPEEADAGIKEGRGYMMHELMPDGSINWLMENKFPAFSNPPPIIKDANGLEFTGTYEIQKIASGTSILKIIIPQDKLDQAIFPLTVDPVTVDSAAASTATAYGGGRKIFRDPYNNLILVCDCGTGDDNVYYKNYDSTTWTDAAVDLDDGAGSSQEIAGDLDAQANNEGIHLAFINSTDSDLEYDKLTINRDTSNLITSITDLATNMDIDTSNKTKRPSLIVANKGEGAGKEKVALSWAMNTTSGGTKKGEIRFLQCDVSDACDAESEWKNVDESLNGGGACSGGVSGLPNSVSCAGAADTFFPVTAHETNHAGLIQVPGRPARTPTAVKFYDGGTSSYTNLTNAIDDNAATNTGSTLDAPDGDDYLYIGDDNKFSKIILDIDNGFACAIEQSCTITVEYYNGSSWGAVNNITINTSSLTGPGIEGSLLYDGTISFDEPSDWATISVDGVTKYWARFDFGSTFNQSDTASIAEIEVGDLHSKDLLIVGGTTSTIALRAVYATWDEINKAFWEVCRQQGTSCISSSWFGTAIVHDFGAAWSTFTNFPLSLTADYVNNVIYLAYMCDENGPGQLCTVTGDNLMVVRAVNNKNLKLDGSWTSVSFSDVSEASDIVLSITSDQNDIYLFYVLDPGTNSLVYRRCDPRGGGTRDICDNASDWSSEKTLASFVSADEVQSHPQAIVSKAYGDTTAIDVIYTDTNDVAVEYERHFVDMADKTIVVAASGDDAAHYDCDTGTHDQSINGFNLGRSIGEINCESSANADIHAGIRFPNVQVGQGAVISSAYLDFRILSDTNVSGPINFSVYGEDGDSAVTDGTGFDALTNCTAPCTDTIGSLTRTTNNTSGSIQFSTQSYRIDVTDIVQELVCRGAANNQPCLGNSYGSGSWSSGNAMALLLIYTGSDVSDNFASIIAFDTLGVSLDPTLQINLGSTNKEYSIGVIKPQTGSGTYSDLGHLLETEEFTAVNTDDSLYASASASINASASVSGTPIFMFKTNNSNNNNTDEISASAIIKSSIPTKSYGGGHASGRTIYLQIYRAGSTNDWTTVDSDTVTAADTDITLSGSVTTNLSDYYIGLTPGASACPTETKNCWTIWRVYQDAAPEANQILYTDLFSVTYVPENVLWLLPIVIFLPKLVPKISNMLRRKKLNYAYI